MPAPKEINNTLIIQSLETTQRKLLRITLVVDTISLLVEQNLFANTHSLSYWNQVWDNSLVVVAIST